MMLDLAGVQKLHEHDQRPAGVTVACLDHLYLTGADTGKHSKSGLGIAGPLADRLEGGWGHSPNPRVVFCLPLVRRFFGLERAQKTLSVNTINIKLPRELGSGLRIEFNNPTFDDGVNHVRFSVAGTLIANKVRVVNRKSDVTQIILAGGE